METNATVLEVPVTTPVKAPKAEKIVHYTIFVDAAGNELMKRANGRGRPRADAVKGADGNYIVKNCTRNAAGEVEVPATPSAVKIAKVAAAKVDRFYIINRKNDDGTVTEVSRAKIGRGKPAKGFILDEATGNKVKFEDKAADFKATVLKAPVSDSTPVIDTIPDVAPTAVAKNDIVDPTIA